MMMVVRYALMIHLIRSTCPRLRAMAVVSSRNFRVLGPCTGTIYMHDGVRCNDMECSVGTTIRTSKRSGYLL